MTLSQDGSSRNLELCNAVVPVEAAPLQEQLVSTSCVGAIMSIAVPLMQTRPVPSSLVP